MKHFFTPFLFIIFFLGWSHLSAQESSKAVSIEDFETGDFSQFEWEQGGMADWTVTDSGPYEGLFSAKSGLITDNQTTSLSLEWEVYAEDTLSFWYKVSSEENYDYLSFYIDGILMDEWSGIVGWTEYIAIVPVGTHTFMWEYNKDYSIGSNDDAAYVDYITFPPEEIEAGFVSDTTVICEGDVVFFYDQSIGPVTEWSWVFEGGTPQTSTDQNPVVGYPDPGVFGVFLEVSDGVETATLYIEDFMTVGSVPEQAPTPSGISFLCASWGNTTYSVSGMSGVSSYDWTLEPPEAGSVSGNGTNVTVVWTPDFLGVANLKVAGINYCGIGVYSNPLMITRYLPDVSLVVPSYISISTPPFNLTGGSPAGGEYSGTGVSNGVFDPAAAGLGEHVITYTYTDPNLCTNSATDILTVTEFTGFSDKFLKSEVQVYPNPNNGSFSLQFNVDLNEAVTINICNNVNKLVFTESGKHYEKDDLLSIDLSDHAAGIYFLQIIAEEFSFQRKIIVK